jgi:hypothetical protein
MRRFWRSGPADRDGGGDSRLSGWIWAAVAGTAGLLLAGEAGVLASQDRKPQAPPEGPTALETVDRDTTPGRPGTTVSPRAVVAAGGFVSVQVNVDNEGNNIVGDAGNEPSIAVDPTAPNRMAIGWRQFDTTASNFREAGFSSSVDGGRSWAGEGEIESGLFRSDPVLTAGEDGTFYYLSLRVTEANDFFCDMFISPDHGATWPDKHFAFGGDKAWITIDRTDGIGAGNLYQAWNVAGNMYFPAQFNRSSDGGVPWEQPVEYDPGPGSARPCFGVLDVGPGGEVYVAGARNSSPDFDPFWVVRSTTAQNPIATPSVDQVVEVDLGGFLRIGADPNPSGLAGQVNLAVNHADGPMNGHVYVVCSVDPPGPDPMDVHFVRSTDGGLNWSSPVRINTDPLDADAWQWFGTMSVAPNGRIDVVWNDTRASGQANISELYYATSIDGGFSWSSNMRVSPSFDSHLGWPNQNKLGDYYDMISDAVGADLAWAATFNGEQDVYYLRLGQYDCNGNGIGDASDLAIGSSADCNGNDIPDECEIAAGTLEDSNGNGVPDICDGCPGDIDGNGVVDVDDLTAVILAWGPCGPPCPPDTDGNGVVDVDDLTEVILGWGECG